jgi:hypothetical protein
MGAALIIAVRGWTNTGDRLLGGRPGGEIPPSALQALQANCANAEVWAPDLDLSMFNMRDAEDVARELYEKIDAKLATLPSVNQVVILSYSAGSLLARRVFCMAYGVGVDGEIAREPVWWAKHVHRLVVLAGITRGWEFSTASPDHVRFLSPVLLSVARAVGLYKSLRPVSGGKLPFIWQLKRGAPFVVSKRIQYVKVILLGCESGCRGR